MLPKVLDTICGTHPKEFIYIWDKTLLKILPMRPSCKHNQGHQSHLRHQPHLREEH
ncbi:unnamed protein product [Allacma fusca]|uniref:Uncharacterized protein n=1 Tax=Allacma fusca TaxID=39272 RepID=A0A8J2LD02_9HEXA|nr:unnamed protein product [Allacma fusca]